MKNKLFAFTLTAALMAGSLGVNAAEAGTVIVNGEQVAVSHTSGDTLMVPVRSVAEALGYKVEWIAESKTVTLTKGASYVTFQIGVDGYTFARTAPMPLGKASEVVEGSTMVPVELFSDIMDLNVRTEDGNVAISTPIIGEAVVSEVGEGTLTVEDSERGTVILNIYEDTVITDEAGTALTPEDITAGAELTVEYGDAMTMSLPPINNPVRLTVKADVAIPEKADVLSITGEVTEITEAGHIVVKAEDESADYPIVALLVTEDTAGNGTEAQVGDKVEATFSPLMTRSIPPQSEAFSIDLK